MCSKCGVCVATNKHPWCVHCKAENQAANREAKLTQAEGSGFSKGIEAMRKTLADEFERYDRDTGGGAMVEIERVVFIIRHAPRPSLVQSSQP